MAAPSSKAVSTPGLSDIQRESGLHLFNRVKRSTDPPGDSYIQGFDSHIVRALPTLQHNSPKSSWTSGDIIEIQGPAASGKTHLLYFWAMTCVLPHKVTITFGDGQYPKDVLLGGREKSVVVCDCDSGWNIRRLNTIMMSYLQDRLASVTPDNSLLKNCSPSASEIVSQCLKRVHIFQPGSTLALATTLMAVPAYHRSQMPNEDIGMLMVDGVSTFYWADRWVSEQVESTFEPPTTGAVPTRTEPTSAARPQPPPLRSDVNPLRHVLTVILQLRRSLGMVTFLTNWGLTTLDSQLPSSSLHFRQHLRVPYPSPFEPEPRTSKLSLAHHITIPYQGPQLSAEGTAIGQVVNENSSDDRAGGLQLRAIVRTLGKRPGEAREVVESEFQFAIANDGILVS